jgi:serine protease
MRVLALLALGLVALTTVQATADFISDVEDPIDNEYIIVLHSNTTVEERDAMIDQLVKMGGALMHPFHINTFIGFSASMDEKLLNIMLEHPLVTFIERNMVMKANTCLQQSDATWGVSRVSHDAVNRPENLFVYDSEKSGRGVPVYIIDSGVQITHNEFEGRAEYGANFVQGESDVDCNGHGTHVAGTAAGKNVGVAKFSTIIAVKVLGCSGSGSTAGVIGGIDWTAKNCNQRNMKNKCVANMSLGGGLSQSLNGAVDSSVKEGVVMVVAAGNENSDACTRSPASAPSALSVGATTETGESVVTDVRASFSNYGRCVDLFAPGQLVKSAWIDVQGWEQNSVYNTISGTSMAAPHACGDRKSVV